MSTITIERPSTEAVESTSPPAGAFTARRADLIEALTSTSLAVAKRGSLPIMGQVLLTCRNGDLTMTTFDGEFAVIVRLPGAATADGQLLLEHAGLTKTLAAIAKGERKADADAMTITVISTTSGPVLAASGYEIPLHASPSVQDFPTLPPVMPGTHVVDRAAFSQTAARVLVAADRGDTLPILTGVRLTLERDSVHLVATDRYRLATARLSATGTSDETTLVLGAFLGKVLKRMSGQTLSISVDNTDGTRWVTWSAGQTTALTLELAGEYPKVASIIPANTECTVTVDRKALAAATIKAAAITKAAAGANTPVRLVVSPAGITVAPSVETGQGQVRAPELDATITGITEMTIGANPTFLGDMLAAFAGETITLHLDTPSKPFVATNEPTGLTDPGAYLHVLMPVRVTD